MNTKKLYFLAFLLVSILFLGAGIQPSVAIPAHSMGNGQITVETDELVVRVTGGGNIPSYFFWAVDNNDTTYRVQFDSVFEATDNDDNGAYDLGTDQMVPASILPLAPLKWQFTEVEEIDTSGGTINFNMTSSAFAGEGSYIQFNNHINSNEANQMKFDVIINGYSFKNANAMLVLAFKLIVANGEDSAEQEGDTVSFGNGFFQSETTASSEGGDVGVGLSTASEESPVIYLAYEHFSGKLEHDPSVGIDASALDQDSDQNTEVLPFELSKGDLITSTLVASVIAILVPVIVFRIKKK